MHCFFCSKLAGQTLFITGASRGIGKAIALKAAKDGANVVIAAKTATPHPKLPGTIYSAAEEGNECHKKIVFSYLTFYQICYFFKQELPIFSTFLY